LSLWAERVYAKNTLAAAFAGEDRQSPRLLLDRVRRILLPGYRPQTPVSPVGFLTFVLAAVIVFFGLACGTKAVVELAAKALTPAERMERIVQTQRQYGTPEVASTEGRVTLSGKIRTRGGEPLPKKIFECRITRTLNCTSHTTDGEQPQEFSIAVEVGTSWLKFEADGYAPALVGPFVGKSGENISGIDVVLDRGFVLPVSVCDEDGKPIEGAQVRGYVSVDGGSIGHMDDHCTTDAKGVGTIPHVAETNYNFKVTKPGYQPIEGTILPVKANRPLAFTLKRTTPVRGVVLSPDGTPVAGAEIREYAKFMMSGSAGSNIMMGRHGSAIAVTDARGRFVLDQLANNAVYALLISAKGHGKHLVRDVTTKQNDLRVDLGPELIVLGTILGDLGRLTKDDGKPTATYGESIDFTAQHSSNGESGRIVVEPIAGGGKFIVRDLLPGDVTITAGDHSVRTTVGSAMPSQEVTIDLTKPMPQYPTRPVVMRFATPDGAVPPEGTIQIHLVRNGENYASENRLVSLEKGVAKFDAFAPGTLMYEPKGLLGYWFEDVHDTRIESAKEPLEISVPVMPAGAIAGQVLDADGKPVSERISVGVTGELSLPKSTRSGGFGADNIAPDAQGKFFAGPLPLGGRYSVAATRGHTVQGSSPILLDAAHPTVKLTLRLPATTAVEGKVLDPNGRPIARLAFGLGFSPPKGPGGNSWGGDIGTDDEGRFRIADLGVGVGTYSLTFTPHRDYCPTRVPLPLDGKPLTVQLQRGLVLEGQLLDEATDRPIAGAEVYAWPDNFQPDDFGCEAEALTDSHGKFRFSNLQDRSYGINNRNGLGPMKIPPDRSWMPGEKQVVIRVSVPEGSRLKPTAKTRRAAEK
jgi:protocatechuate 3,4-dioxygenase beta subunit